MKNDKLSYILTSYGKINCKDGRFTREYFITDHLGNVRIVFNEEGKLIQENHYYAHGLLSPLSKGDRGINDYLYNGKELQEEFNLNYYNYGWRQLDPQLGIWHSVDKLAEMYPSESPYSYAGNNPISYVDIDGLFYEWKADSNHENGGYWVDTDTGNETSWNQIYNETLDAAANGGGYTYDVSFSDDLMSLLNENGGGDYYAEIRTGGVLIYSASWKTGNLTNNQGQFFLADHSDVFVEKNNPIEDAVRQSTTDFMNHPATQLVGGILLEMVTGGILSTARIGIQGARAVYKYRQFGKVNLNPLFSRTNCSAVSAAGKRFLDTGIPISALNVGKSHPKILAQKLGLNLTKGNMSKNQLISFILKQGDASSVIVNASKGGNWVHAFNAQVRYGRVIFWDAQVGRTATSQGIGAWMIEQGWTSFNVIF